MSMPKKDCYEVDLAESRSYDYTKGHTTTIVVCCSHYPDADEIEDTVGFFRVTGHPIGSAGCNKVCNISGPLSESELESLKDVRKIDIY